MAAPPRGVKDVSTSDPPAVVEVEAVQTNGFISNRPVLPLVFALAAPTPTGGVRLTLFAEPEAEAVPVDAAPGELALTSTNADVAVDPPVAVPPLVLVPIVLLVAVAAALAEDVPEAALASRAPTHDAKAVRFTVPANALTATSTRPAVIETPRLAEPVAAFRLILLEFALASALPMADPAEAVVLKPVKPAVVVDAPDADARNSSVTIGSKAPTPPAPAVAAPD